MDDRQRARIRRRIARFRRSPTDVTTEQLASLAQAAEWQVTRGGRHQWKFVKGGQHFTLPDHPGSRGKGLVLRVLRRIEESLD